MNFRLVGHSIAALSAAVFFLFGAASASAAPPANDNIANAQVIAQVLPVTVQASTLESTAEAGEPDIGGNAAQSTVWFLWTAGFTGTTVVNLCNSGFTGSDYPTEMFAVRQGAGFGALVEDQVGECLLRFNATIGVTYKIQVSFNGDQGNFALRLRQLTPPANDNFASATVIGALPANIPSTNVDSTHQVGEPAFLGGASSSRSVWYRWTAPSNGQVRIDVCDYERVAGAANRALGVYTGVAVNALLPVTTTNNCELSFTPVAGTVYSIGFSGYISGEMTFTFRMKNAPPPSNDNFANATSVGPALPVTVQGSNEFSTVQAGEPSHGGIGGTPAYSSWFNWTPAQNMRVRIKTCGKTFNPRLGVYTGLAVNALTEVGEAPPYGPYCTKLLNAVAGTTYRIAAAGGPQDGEYGPYVLDIHVLDIPGNDDLEDAATLSSDLPASVEGTTIDATYSDFEPYHDPDSSERTASVWYRWTAESDDAIIFSACSEGEPNRIAVYSGTGFEDFDRLASAGEGCRDGLNGGRLAIAPVAGQTYLIVVAAEERDYESDFTLSAIGPPVVPPVVDPPVVDPPKTQFNLKKAIKKCKKIKGKSRKAKKKRANCIKKARKKAAIIQCRKIVSASKEKQCIKKAQRKFK